MGKICEIQGLFFFCQKEQNRLNISQDINEKLKHVGKEVIISKSHYIKDVFVYCLLPQ